MPVRTRPPESLSTGPHAGELGFYFRGCGMILATTGTLASEEADDLVEQVGVELAEARAGEARLVRRGVAQLERE